MKKLYRGPYIDVFCQVWFHFAQLFQRSRLKYEKVNEQTTDARRTRSDGNTSPDGSGELKRGMKFKKSSSLKLLGQLELNFA
jgi:hypothetical protein